MKRVAIFLYGYKILTMAIKNCYTLKNRLVVCVCVIMWLPFVHFCSASFHALQVCQNSTRSNVPCFTVREKISAALGREVTSHPEVYVPTCTINGRFNQIQCNTSTGLCWCVNVQSGRPVSSYSPHGTRPQCPGQSLLLVKRMHS